LSGIIGKALKRTSTPIQYSRSKLKNQKHIPFDVLLTLSLTGSWPPSISLLEACSGPLKRATLAKKRLF
jgi:hypothetical protein